MINKKLQKTKPLALEAIQELSDIGLIWDKRLGDESVFIQYPITQLELERVCNLINKSEQYIGQISMGELFIRKKES